MFETFEALQRRCVCFLASLRHGCIQFAAALLNAVSRLSRRRRQTYTAGKSEREIENDTYIQHVQNVICSAARARRHTPQLPLPAQLCRLRSLQFIRQRSLRALGTKRYFPFAGISRRLRRSHTEAETGR